MILKHASLRSWADVLDDGNGADDTHALDDSFRRRNLFADNDVKIITKSGRRHRLAGEGEARQNVDNPTDIVERHGLGVVEKGCGQEGVPPQGRSVFDRQYLERRKRG